MDINLLKLRREKGVNQEEVAAVIGVTRQAFSRYERGERELGYDSLVRLAKYFDVSVDYLLGSSSYFYPDKVGSYPFYLSEDEQEVLELYAALSPSRKEDLKIYLRALSGSSADSASTTNMKKI